MGLQLQALSFILNSLYNLQLQVRPPNPTGGGDEVMGMGPQNQPIMASAHVKGPCDLRQTLLLFGLSPATVPMRTCPFPVLSSQLSAQLRWSLPPTNRLAVSRSRLHCRFMHQRLHDATFNLRYYLLSSSSFFFFSSK